MEIDNDIARTLRGQGLKDYRNKMQYDAEAKRILADPQVLSRIVSSLVPGFKHLSPEEVMSGCLIGSIDVSKQPVSRADRAIEKVAQLNNEDTTVTEGKVTFDVYTQLKLPGGEDVAVELNLEEQDAENKSYPLEKRATYYIARLLSIQGEGIAAEMCYELLHRVVSIWIVIDPYEQNRGTISHTHLVTEDLVGVGDHKIENTDLADIFYVGLNSKEPGTSSGIIGMLEILFAKAISADEKIERLSSEYNLSMRASFEEGVKRMSSLGEAIERKAEARGEARGEAKGEAKLVITCMKAYDCEVEEALARIGVDRADWPSITKAVEEYLMQPVA